jgi:hypothetical protein
MDRLKDAITLHDGNLQRPTSSNIRRIDYRQIHLPEIRASKNRIKHAAREENSKFLCFMHNFGLLFSKRRVNARCSIQLQQVRATDTEIIDSRNEMNVLDGGIV